VRAAVEERAIGLVRRIGAGRKRQRGREERGRWSTFYKDFRVHFA